jgi:O-antigen/teichoic acid export membrane protein
VSQAPSSTATSGGASGATPPAGMRRGRLASLAAVEVFGFGSAQLIRLGSNLVLARLLFPAAFGLMAMLSLVLYGIYMLTDVGLSQAVVRSPRGDDPVYLDTAWSIQATRGLALWALGALLAWPISLLFREPQLLPMIPVGTAVAFLHGLASTRILSLRRHFRPLPIVWLEISSQVAGAATMIGLAWAGVGVWSLVAGNLVQASLHTAFSFALPGEHRERYRIDAESRKEITHFGRWIFASSAMTFLAGRGDQLVLARLLGAASLGLYNLALVFAEAPDLLVNRVISGILYPLYARVHNENPGQLRHTYYRTRLALDAVVQTGLGGLCGLAPWLIHLLYDSRYYGAIPMLQILTIRAGLGLVASPCETVLTAQGLSEYGFRRNLVVAVSTFLLMPLGNWLGGTLGLLWGTTLARATSLVVLWPAARERGILWIERELLALPFFAVGAGVGWALLFILPGR